MESNCHNPLQSVSQSVDKLLSGIIVLEIDKTGSNSPTLAGTNVVFENFC